VLKQLLMNANLGAIEEAMDTDALGDVFSGAIDAARADGAVRTADWLESLDFDDPSMLYDALVLLRDK
jgi:hypothetical protein